MSEILYSKQLEVRKSVDVFIAGGGPAGCAAAIAAARHGCSVFLAESQSSLGGMGTVGMIPAYMQFGDGDNFLAAGIGREILERLWKYGGEEYEKSKTYSIKAEALKRVYDDMLTEAGVEFVFQTSMIDVNAADGKVNYCVLSSKSGVYAVKAKIYIDGTGDADLCAWAGAPYEKGDENGNMMAATLCSLWANIDWKNVKGWDGRELEKAIDDGVFFQPDRHLPGMWKISNTVGGGNIGHTYGVDGTDEATITKAMVLGRKLVSPYEKYYKEYLTGYENMELTATGSLLGIRESRRVVCDYNLVLDDFFAQANFDDEIGRYCYPVDIHASDNSKESHAKFSHEHSNFRYKKGESYGVPYRILLPQGLDNVFVTGRCVGTDRPMQSSIRVMPGCYITGQGAGVAAAICVKDGVDIRGVDVVKLQGMLRDMGMYMRD